MIARPSVLRHLDAPEVLLEEGHRVGRRRRTGAAPTICLVEPNFQASALCVDSRNAEKGLVAHLPVEGPEKDRALVVEEALADLGAAQGVAGDPDAVRERDRRGVPAKSAPRRQRFSRPRATAGLRRSFRNRNAQYSANDSASHCSSALGIRTTMPQYWWAISWAKILAISCASKRLMSPTSGIERLLRDEHGRRRRLAEAVVVDLEDVELGKRERPEELPVVGDDLRRDLRELLHGRAGCRARTSRRGS